MPSKPPKQASSFVLPIIFLEEEKQFCNNQKNAALKASPQETYSGPLYGKVSTAEPLQACMSAYVLLKPQMP